MGSQSDIYTFIQFTTVSMRIKNPKGQTGNGEDLKKETDIILLQGVLTLGDVQRHGAKQRLCTVIHIVCGFMRGQMVPLKQEVIDIMTWSTVECWCMCVLNECMRVSKDTL